MATKGMTSSGKVGTMGIFLMGAILFAQEIVFNKINIEQATAEMFNVLLFLVSNYFQILTKHRRSLSIFVQSMLLLILYILE